MKIHELKVWPDYFFAVYAGTKRFELRRDDRGFAVMDILALREWDPETQKYTGRICNKQVGYILRDFPGLEPGYCIMSLTDF